jgi:LPS export ABC transporter protein LptC
MRSLDFNRIFKLLIIVFVFTSCKNDIKKLTSLAMIEETPVQWLKNAELIYSDSGEVQMILKTPLINRYLGDNPYNEFPKGIIATFYNSKGKIISWLTANYAISFEKKKTIEAKNDVVFVNTENNEKLNTEHLIWDQRKAMIYSDKFVKITTKDEVLLGEGFESDEAFNKWTIKNPKGSFPVEVKASK